MARLRYNGLTATLGAALASGDTTITFAAPLTHAGGAVPTISGSDTIALSILDAGGAVVEIVSLTAYTSGATTGTIARAQEGTAAATHASGDAVVHSPTAADFGTGGGAEIAYAEHYPATGDVLSTASTTLVDVHADLSVTFTAPASGKVTVTLNALASASVNGGAAYWALRSGTTKVAGTERLAASVVTNDRAHVPIRISGLTPGASYTYKWAHRTYNSSNPSKILSGPTSDGDNGPASMTVTER